MQDVFCKAIAARTEQRRVLDMSCDLSTLSSSTSSSFSFAFNKMQDDEPTPPSSPPPPHHHHHHEFVNEPPQQEQHQQRQQQQQPQERHQSIYTIHSYSAFNLRDPDDLFGNLNEATETDAVAATIDEVNRTDANSRVLQSQTNLVMTNVTPSNGGTNAKLRSILNRIKRPLVANKMLNKSNRQVQQQQQHQQSAQLSAPSDQIQRRSSTRHSKRRAFMSQRNINELEDIENENEYARPPPIHFVAKRGSDFVAPDRPIVDSGNDSVNGSNLTSRSRLKAPSDHQHNHHHHHHNPMFKLWSKSSMNVREATVVSKKGDNADDDSTRRVSRDDMQSQSKHLPILRQQSHLEQTPSVSSKSSTPKQMKKKRKVKSFLATSTHRLSLSLANLAQNGLGGSKSAAAAAAQQQHQQKRSELFAHSQRANSHTPMPSMSTHQTAKQAGAKKRSMSIAVTNTNTETRPSVNSIYSASKETNWYMLEELEHYYKVLGTFIVDTFESNSVRCFFCVCMYVCVCVS